MCSAYVCFVLALAAAAHQAADFRTTGAVTEGVGDPVQIVFLVSGGDKRRVASAEQHLARHLRRPGEAPISFHLVTDKAWPSEMVEGWATPHLLSSMPAAALDLHANFSRITHGPGSIYMWKPLLPWLLPASLTRVMVLDADLVLTRSVHELCGRNSTPSAPARPSGWRGSRRRRMRSSGPRRASTAACSCSTSDGCAKPMGRTSASSAVAPPARAVTSDTSATRRYTRG